jgi:hypothetical protein
MGWSSTPVQVRLLAILGFIALSGCYAQLHYYPDRKFKNLAPSELAFNNGGD